MPPDVCKKNGYCDVYQQSTSQYTYKRIPGTEWCSCTVDICFTECPNSFLCGVTLAPKWYLDAHGGRCYPCNLLVGKKLEVSTGTGLECGVCLDDDCTMMVGWPWCTAKHSFCVPCMRSMLLRSKYVMPICRVDEVEEEEEEEEEDDEDEEEDDEDEDEEEEEDEDEEEEEEADPRGRRYM